MFCEAAQQRLTQSQTKVDNEVALHMLFLILCGRPQILCDAASHLFPRQFIPSYYLLPYTAPSPPQQTISHSKDAGNANARTLTPMLQIKRAETLKNHMHKSLKRVDYDEATPIKKQTLSVAVQVRIEVEKVA